MCELNIIYYHDFWYFVNENEMIFEMDSLPLRAKLLRKFKNDIEEIYHLRKKNNSIKLIFQKDNDNLWILLTITN